MAGSPQESTGASPRWMVSTVTRVLTGMAIVVMTFGCSRSPTVIPEAPPDAVVVVIEGLADQQPQVLWDALPASYQSDIRDMIMMFSIKMDSNIYDRAFRILGKTVKVMQEKEDYIIKSPIVLSTPLLESSIGSQWDETVDLVNTIAQSELSSLESLRRMDPGDFLASTGRKVMQRLEEFRNRTQRSPGLNRWERMSHILKQAHLEFVQTSDGQGVLTFSSPTNTAVKEVKLAQVEGRWIPADMAGTWQEKVEQARVGMEKLNGPEFQKIKPMLSMVLGSLEGGMDSLLRAGSQKEFDDTLKSLASIGAMLKSMRGSNPPRSP